MMELRFDHVVVVTDHLQDALDAYRSVGFPIVPGGRHAHLPTHNALVPLQGGGYLELLAAIHPAVRPLLRALYATPLHHLLLAHRSVLQRRFLRLAGGPLGVADYCLWTDQMDALVERWRGAGLRVEGPYAMGRTRPDGTRLEWRLAFAVGAGFPFVIEDRTPQSDRVPDTDPRPGAELPWPLSIHVAVSELGKDVARHHLLLGVEPIRRSDRYAVFLLGAVQVVLEAHPAGSRMGAIRMSLAVAARTPVQHAVLHAHRISLFSMPREDAW